MFFFLLSWLLLGGFGASSLLFGFGASSVDRLIILPSPLLFQPSPTQSCIERKGRKKGRKKDKTRSKSETSSSPFAPSAEFRALQCTKREERKKGRKKNRQNAFKVRKCLSSVLPPSSLPLTIETQEFIPSPSTSNNTSILKNLSFYSIY
jgi:hypothetical protein